MKEEENSLEAPYVPSVDWEDFVRAFENRGKEKPDYEWLREAVQRGREKGRWEAGRDTEKQICFAVAAAEKRVKEASDREWKMFVTVVSILVAGLSGWLCWTISAKRERHEAEREWGPSFALERKEQQERWHQEGARMAYEEAVRKLEDAKQELEDAKRTAVEAGITVPKNQR